MENTKIQEIDLDIYSLVDETPIEKEKRIENERIQLVEKIKKSKINYFLNENNFDESINNIIFFCVVNAKNEKKALENCNKIIDVMNFNVLYKKEQDWNEYVLLKFNRIYNKIKDKHGEDTVFKFILEKDILDYIPCNELVIPKENNPPKILRIEIFVILRSIIFNLLNNNGEKILVQNYFLSDSFKEKFKKETGRKINSAKLSRITTLLDNYKLIRKEYIYTKGSSKSTVTNYKIGELGFYSKKLIR